MAWRTILPPSINDSSEKKTAEERFRDAFERLKVNEPIRLPEGTPVSQNHVAKEAGCDPTALRKSRFPTLVWEIQQYVQSHEEERQQSARQQLLKRRKRNRKARETIADFKRQRDAVVGLLADANLRIVELTEDLASAKAELEETRPSAPVISLTRRNPDLRICGGSGEVRGPGENRDAEVGGETAGRKNGGHADGEKYPLKEMASVVDLGLVADSSSYLKLKVKSDDILGALAQLLPAVARTRAIVSIINARVLTVGNMEVFLELETQRKGHIDEVVKHLSSQGHQVEVMM